MEVSPETRALQHLLVQGFTLYPARAAICTRLVDKSILDNPGHVWAVFFEQPLTFALPEEDGLAQIFFQAAQSATSQQVVICHSQGSYLLVPLTVTDVREAKMKIDSAVAVGMAPPEEKLEAFPEELIEREYKRRQKLKESALVAASLRNKKEV